MDHHKGSCHCGQVRFEAEVDIERITVCNCSICTKKGFLHHRVQPENFRLIASADILATYQFGTMAARHQKPPSLGENRTRSLRLNALPGTKIGH